ncbi:MAG: carboxypeptidase-like regulatory domain-containing protein [Prolixibacteraceae bacterium]|nr:carboxypeptidase-like regulatory domain-containing protein [Prolixibacteraceae bacterium]
MLKQRFYIVLILMLVSVFQGWAQNEIIDPILIQLNGQLISAADSSAVPYATIINHRTHTGVTSNADGYFKLEMLNIDSLEVSSVGYLDHIIKVPYNYSGHEVLIFKILPKSYAIGQVNVEGEKPKIDLGLGTGKPVDIPPELRGSAFNETPPILAAFFNPISYWHYYLSKREKSKREVRKAILLEKNWEMHSQNYNKEVVMNLTGMNTFEADSFMIWFNAQDILPYTSNVYQVRAAIVEYFHYYRIDKAMEQ